MLVLNFKDDMDSLILKFICQNCHPLSITEQPGFKEMFIYSLPGYKLKGRYYFTQLLEKKYVEIHGNLKEKLKHEYLSLTTDTWSNRKNDKSFLR